MREGGLRRILVPPGPLQAQGTKSLVWVAGLLEALDEAGGAPGAHSMAGRERGAVVAYRPCALRGKQLLRARTRACMCACVRAWVPPQLT